MGDVVLGAQLLQPVGAAAARGNDRVLGIDLQVSLAVGNGDSAADLVLQDQVAALVAEVHLHTVLLEILLDSQIDGLGFFRAHVADGAVHKLQARLNGTLADLLPLLFMLQALDMGVRAEFQIDLVGVVDGLLGQVLSDKSRQIAAHLVA